MGKFIKGDTKDPKETWYYLTGQVEDLQDYGFYTYDYEDLIVLEREDLSSGDIRIDKSNLKFSKVERDVEFNLEDKLEDLIEDGIVSPITFNKENN